MALCLKCSCWFDKPGTCNCYAPKEAHPTITNPQYPVVRPPMKIEGTRGGVVMWGNTIKNSGGGFSIDV